MPYTAEFFDAAEPPLSKPTDKPANDSSFFFDPETLPEPEFLNGPLAPMPWMNLAIEEDRRRHLSRPKHAPGLTTSDFFSQRHGGDFGWLWGRVVLLMSDSIDREMITHFCEEFGGGVFEEPAKHTTSWCTVPAFNLTLLHWHSDGLLRRRFEPYWDPFSKWVSWEDRFEHVWNSSFERMVGVNGKGPDLVLWQSALWDQRNFAELGKLQFGEQHHMADMGRQMVWEELRHYGARARGFLEFLRKEFGREMPLMLRAGTIHRDTPARDLMVYDADRLERALAEQFGLEIFEWGRLVAGQTGMYQDYHHLGRGPASWLWGTMLLEYLARIANVGMSRRGVKSSIVPGERERYFQGWMACHKELIEWGGR